MSEPSIFTKIINGEIPCHKVYEDDKTIAFLDINPIQPGHTLVVPKVQVERFEDLDDETTAALMKTVRRVMHKVIHELDVKQACLKVEGFRVPHTHVHVVPCNSEEDMQRVVDYSVDPNHDQLADIAATLRFS
ncbi:HIT family protein [Candidatus Saccharibacteria bacterium]|nr:MAG: HIT family protein [Candidatus Saccharibacteria bacterium]